MTAKHRDVLFPDEGASRLEDKQLNTVPPHTVRHVDGVMHLQLHPAPPAGAEQGRHDNIADLRKN